VLLLSCVVVYLCCCVSVVVQHRTPTLLHAHTHQHPHNTNLRPHTPSLTPTPHTRPNTPANTHPSTPTQHTLMPPHSLTHSQLHTPTPHRHTPCLECFVRDISVLCTYVPDRCTFDPHYYGQIKNTKPVPISLLVWANQPTNPFWGAHRCARL